MEPNVNKSGQPQSVRPKGAANLLGVGVSTFWRWVKERSDFPKPRKLSSRCTVFESTSIS
ncbi:MAG: AlpA family phage regulatory protein [Comamonas sp.]|nr:AlpA family phage regulatory protein [Candidatus Comamonas equi]